MLPNLTQWLRGALRILLFGCAAIVAAAADAVRPFDVPTGNAAQTLKRFAAEAGSEIVFAPSIADVVTHKVHGNYTPKEALDEMLSGTDLVATQDRTGAFAVKRSERRPVAARSPTPTTPANDLVTLSPFLVAADSVGRYTATEATSGTRVRIALMDSPQSVSVVTRDVIDDIGAMRILDAAKYVAGVSESTIPNAQDRTNVRGFQTDGATIDGFHFFSYSNVDPAIVERIEVVKGPNAVLSPQIVQGTINLVSKKPVFSDRGYVAAEVGRFNADRAEVDWNQTVSGAVAVRVVASAQRSHDQADGNFRDTQLALPMATFRLGPKTLLTVQVQIYNTYSAAYGGLPIDPNVGTNDHARLLAGVPTDLDLYTRMAARHDTAGHYRLFLTAEPIEHLSVRVAANAIRWTGSSVGISIGNPLDPITGGQSLRVAVNPLTGDWMTTGQTGDNLVFPRAGTVVHQSRTSFNVQGDLAYDRQVGSTRSTTLVGYMLDYSKNPLTTVNFTMAPLVIRSPTVPPYTVADVNNSTATYSADEQVYLNQVVSCLGNRVVLSGGVAQVWYKTYLHDLRRSMTVSSSPAATLPSAGVVVKPLREIAVFVGASRQSTAVTPSTTASIPFELQTGRQHEVGLRAQLLDGRVFGTLSYYTISQSNFAVPNPVNSNVPPPTPSLPPLFSDLRIYGTELELRAALTPSFSLVGSASRMRARNPVGQPFRGIAERAGAAWLNYTFRTGRWHGLSFGLGLDYLGKRPGDVPSSSPTSASTPAHLIMPQPSFWLPARILLNAGISYRRGPWKSQLNVDNLTNESYLAASTGRNTVFPGTPINPRLTVSYSY